MASPMSNGSDVKLLKESLVLEFDLTSSLPTFLWWISWT